MVHLTALRALAGELPVNVTIVGEGSEEIGDGLRGAVEVTVTVRVLSGAVHSGRFGGAAPDALVALIRMLSTLHAEIMLLGDRDLWRTAHPG